MKKILIVEGNLKEENTNFSKAGIKTHTQSLKDSLAFLTNELVLDVVNPSSDQNIRHFNENLDTYDGLIWGGSSLNIYNDTPEIRKQIEFMKNCQNKVKNILAICWGMQVAVTAAGGQVKKAENPHIGIAKEIEININGLNHPLYKGKNRKFNSPAFNFDEVIKLPEKGICLASNKVNKVQSLYFEINNTKVWGLQYHPEITFEKMISLIEFRKKKLIEIRKAFKNEHDVDKHISLIKDEILVTDKRKKMLEIQNWLKELD